MRQPKYMESRVMAALRRAALQLDPRDSPHHLDSTEERFCFHSQILRSRTMRSMVS